MAAGAPPPARRLQRLRARGRLLLAGPVGGAFQLTSLSPREDLGGRDCVTGEKTEAQQGPRDSQRGTAPGVAHQSGGEADPANPPCRVCTLRASFKRSVPRRLPTQRAGAGRSRGTWGLWFTQASGCEGQSCGRDHSGENCFQTLPAENQTDPCRGPSEASGTQRWETCFAWKFNSC